MILITGGAGMIGSIMAWHLNTQLGRDDLIIVDHITQSEQWQNLVHRRYAEYLDKGQLFEWLAENQNISAVIHMGAISATTEPNFNKLVQDNIQYSQDLWDWCTKHQVPFLYASSAATYGDGTQGYADASIANLRPLNGYGYSKHFFDQWALKQASQQTTPPAWAGFKFFNVYGPNEYHKGRMASVALHTFNQFKATGTMKIFKSQQSTYANGMQLRDFVYVKDTASVMAYFLTSALNHTPATNGIYNIGTGQARSFNDLANNVMQHMGHEPHITYIDMPEDLDGKYQYHTQADISKLRQAGYQAPFISIEHGIKDYVQNYLLNQDPYC